ncbi:MAG TPA: DUF4010 domain-containing protein [Candidatus Baltobacteraceae bacterium]|nr:DUF4010 domain-containing protein [Candidatus Baltobacteraceae bacterium]
MTALTDVGAERFALLLGLSLFFGFAFEEFYSGELPRHPGGVRTFPLLALAGGVLFLVEPHYGAAFIAGLLIVGSWIYAYVSREMQREGDPGEGTFIVPISNVLAYVLGAVALTQALWVSTALAVAAVLLLGGKRTLHDWAHRLSNDEVLTAGKFLILVAVVLPLMAGRPAIPHTTITPLGVWLAVVAVSSISYVSYLLQAYVFPKRGTLLSAVLGGLYSSTATTVVLARRAHEQGMTAELESGIIAATAMMYLRTLGVCALFSRALASMLVGPFVVLFAIGLAAAWVRARFGTRTQPSRKPPNPLQLSAAFIFAALFVVVALATDLVQAHLGRGGVLGLAAFVGVTDIDPFVLSLAQGGAVTTGLNTAALAIVIATSSNNVLKAVYAVAFSRCRGSWAPAAALVALAALGLVAGFLFVR